MGYLDGLPGGDYLFDMAVRAASEAERHELECAICQGLDRRYWSCQRGQRLRATARYARGYALGKREKEQENGQV